jgi:hypothetical protein
MLSVPSAGATQRRMTARLASAPGCPPPSDNITHVSFASAETASLAARHVGVSKRERVLNSTTRSLDAS